ncbi:MAG TPA: nucleotidyltransferase family protein [Anaerolineae bacterium]|nr:nucleotidyltransferase family protein [Anaerolineae bacterium]
MTPLNQLCAMMAGWLNTPEPQNPDWSPKSWETFQFASRVHGVAPLLFAKLSVADWLDEALKSWLAEQYHFNAQRLAKIKAELKTILALFSQHQIPVMPLKGSILAATYYPEAGLRPMADLDLLIRPQDFASSATLLVQLGYRQEVVHWKHTEFSRPDNRRVVSTTCEHPDNPRKLEVHRYCRETFGGPTVELTEIMWRNAVQDELLGEPVLLVKPEALWLHLLVHTTYHMWQGKGRLIHLVDLSLLLPHLDDPLPLLNSVEARFTYPSLILLKKYFPAALDDALLATQHPRVSPSFRQWAASLDLVNTSHLNPKPPGLYLSRAIKFTEGRPREVAQALRFALLPSLEEIALDHPKLAQSRAPWLAYFLLPVDWAKRVIN